MPTVPPLPDTERIVSYTVASPSTGPFDIAFDLYGDDDDPDAWIEVWLDGVQQVGNWTLTSDSGSDLSILPRPITDGKITLDGAETGELIIVGARRPRRAIQFVNGQGENAYAKNRSLTDIIATEREMFDDLSRALRALPGETFNRLPSKDDLASNFLAFDANGEPIAADGISETPISAFWADILDDSDASALFTGVIQTITGSSGTVNDATDILLIKRSAPSTTAVTLPDASLRSGRELLVKDYSSSVTEHTTTLTPHQASQKIDRMATWPLYSSGDGSATPAFLTLSFVTLKPIVDPDDGSNFIWIVK